MVAQSIIKKNKDPGRETSMAVILKKEMLP